MSRIHNAFVDANGKAKKAFIGFVTGGDPSIEKTEEFIVTMIDSGCDLVEIGIPFSDPIAEGPVIQEANIRALTAGATVEKLFSLVERLRKKTQVPLAFLTYLNPVFRYGMEGGGASGYEKFMARCEKAGVDGLIIPDLPFEEQDEVKIPAAKHGVDLISLVAPTSEERVAQIAAKASGFLYLVSSMGVTGVRSNITTDLAAIVAAAKKAAPALPAAVGFGIHTAEQAAQVAKAADGVIVGSAIVKIIAQYGSGAAKQVGDYVKQMKAAIGT